MASQSPQDEAGQARALGNDLYRAGKLESAAEAYNKAAALAPSDPLPLSNLSAVRFEMGDYSGAVETANKALGLTEDVAMKDKLSARLAKCHAYLQDIKSASSFMSAVENDQLKADLRGLAGPVESKLALGQNEAAYRKQILDQLSRYKPYLQNVAEYYPCGHDSAEALVEPFVVPNKKLDVSFLFAGCGDGRNAYYAMAEMAAHDLQANSAYFQKLHFTLLDLKPAALARVLILLSTLKEAEELVKQRDEEGINKYACAAYIFSCLTIPAFVHTRMQSTIKSIIQKLENKESVADFVYVPESDRERILHVLRQWQQPWDGLRTAAQARKNDRHWANMGENGTESERKDFEIFRTMLPPEGASERCEPEIIPLVQQYRATGDSKALVQYLDANWHINNTFIDYDFSDMRRSQGDPDAHPCEVNPLASAQALGAVATEKSSKATSIERLCRAFHSFGASISALGNRLTVELIIGEVADVMERMRYNLLDHRAVSSTAGRTLDPTQFPVQFDYIHLSNIPDYIGGHLTTFLNGRPLLKNNQPSSLRFNNLLNPPEFKNHEMFQSEYLLMHNMDRISQHFHVKKRPSRITDSMVPPQFRGMFSAFAFENYMTWNAVPVSHMSFQQLMSRYELDKLVYGHLLKICVPYPRPVFSGSPVHAALNLTSLIRLMISLYELGYPAHWLQKAMACICAGVINTSARPPAQLVMRPEDIDARLPLKEFSVQPWAAEFSTMLSLWRPLIPFGLELMNDVLAPLEGISKYSITFPTYPEENENLPHFMLVFWNEEAGYTMAPPSNLYSLLSGGDGDGQASAADIRAKAIVCSTTFSFHTASRTAQFWMRSDKIEEMKKGKWKAFIWRTDKWTAVTRGVDVSTGVAVVQNGWNF